MASTSYTVTGVKKQYACSIELGLEDTPSVQYGAVTILPDTLIANWGRTGSTWYLVAISVSGPRLVRGELRPTDRRVMRFQKVEDAPRWVQAAARSNTPAQ